MEEPSFELTNTQKITEKLGWILLAALWIYTLVNFSNLPDTIPIHYNGAGQADGFGNRIMIFSLPIVATVLSVTLTNLSKRPHQLNYPFAITEENAEKQYRNAATMIGCLSLLVTLLLGAIVFKTVQYARGEPDGLGAWFLPASGVLIFLLLICFVAKAFLSK